MKRIVSLGVGAYLGLALLGLARERSGSVTCECRSDCWCQRRDLRLFRWVFPIWHSVG